MSDFVTAGPAPASGDLAGFDVNGRQVAVANVDGTLYAFDDVCTHQQCLVSGGELDGTNVICPCHGGTYDVRTGEVLAGPPPAPLATFPAREENGSVQIQL